MSRRNIELVLLLVAAPVVALLFVMIAINEGQQVNVDSLSVPIGIFAAFVVAHLAVRKLAPGADPALLPLAFGLSGIGIAFITRIAPFTDAPNMAQGQVVWLFVGVACMIVVLALFRNLDKIANYKYTLMLVGILLLLSPMVPGLGQEIYGSRIWLHIGGFSCAPAWVGHDRHEQTGETGIRAPGEAGWCRNPALPGARHITALPRRSPLTEFKDAF